MSYISLAAQRRSDIATASLPTNRAAKTAFSMNARVILGRPVAGSDLDRCQHASLLELEPRQLVEWPHWIGHVDGGSQIGVGHTTGRIPDTEREAASADGRTADRIYIVARRERVPDVLPRNCSWTPRRLRKSPIELEIDSQ